MADKTKIEWATLGMPRGATFNPLRAFRKDDGKRGWACVRRNAACKNCYAATMNQNRYYGNGLDYTVGNLAQVDLRLVDVEKPLSWKVPRGIFWCSMTDVFGEFVPADFTAQMIAVAARAQRHRHAFLTKRTERMLEFFQTSDWHGNFPNHVWLGATVHDQACAEEFMPHLLELRKILGEQAIIWISAEPLLGMIDLSKWLEKKVLSWVVAGGESGSKARPMHPNWVRSLREQCECAGVKFFFKQWGEYEPAEMISRTAFVASGKKSVMLHVSGEFRYYDQPEVCVMNKMKKKYAGRLLDLLDGKVWSEFPL